VGPWGRGVRAEQREAVDRRRRRLRDVAPDSATREAGGASIEIGVNVDVDPRADGRGYSARRHRPISIASIFSPFRG